MQFKEAEKLLGIIPLLRIVNSIQTWNTRRFANSRILRNFRIENRRSIFEYSKNRKV